MYSYFSLLCSYKKWDSYLLFFPTGKFLGWKTAKFTVSRGVLFNLIVWFTNILKVSSLSITVSPKGYKDKIRRTEFIGDFFGEHIHF